MRERPSCRDQALKLLAARAHFRRELGGKLATRGYHRSEIEGALDRLATDGLIDDFATARVFVEQRLARGGEGTLKLRAELERRGAPADAIRAVLADLPDDEGERARAAAARWARGGKSDPAALARHLAGKGFSRTAIGAVLRERGSEREAVEPDDVGDESPA